ncbi:hypothetical protein QBC40DRAFT_297233 [Triangularia verruculosa]|uniref:Uncharacterized protein n=1 Tax=Triangularia verruculosa TaxID=2587418 RepID=A0AAN6XFW8_9PEZI|nr:hypothetical protein QBC40DRAFT_297233 [Triangularia verruculosa]
MASPSSDEQPYNSYAELWSPPIPTGDSWESRPTDLSPSPGVDQEAYFRESSLAMSYSNNDDYYRGTSPVQYPTQNGYPPDDGYSPGDGYPAQDEHSRGGYCFQEEYPPGGELSSPKNLDSDNGLGSQSLLYSSSNLDHTDAEGSHQQNAYGSTLDADFSRLKLKEVDQNYGGSWIEDERDATGAQTANNRMTSTMYGPYQYQGQPSFYADDNYTLSAAEEPVVHEEPKHKHSTSHTSRASKQSTSRTSKTQKHSNSQGSKTPKQSKEHDHRATKGSHDSFPRDQWDTWVYLSNASQLSPSTPPRAVKARYDNSNFLGAIITTSLAYQLGFDEGIPLVERNRQPYRPPGFKHSIFTMGTVALNLQFHPDEEIVPGGTEFHMLESVFDGCDVLLPVYMMSGYQGDSYQGDSVPFVAATQKGKYNMDNETEEEMRERERRQREEAEKRERERQARRRRQKS